MIAVLTGIAAGTYLFLKKVRDSNGNSEATTSHENPGPEISNNATIAPAQENDVRPVKNPHPAKETPKSDITPEPKNFFTKSHYSGIIGRSTTSHVWNDML